MRTNRRPIAIIRRSCSDSLLTASQSDGVFGNDIVNKLNKEINAALADLHMKARVADLGGDVLALSPTDFGQVIADDTEKWGKVIKTANIKPE
jgi:hypothetical protein